MSVINQLLFLNVGSAEFMLILFALLPLALTIFCLVDILQTKFSDAMNKQIWVLIVILMPLIGSFLYLVMAKKQQVR